jgi:PKD repeat protein
MQTLHQQMLAEGIPHTWVEGVTRAHHWNSGWLEIAIAGLDSVAPPNNQPPVAVVQAAPTTGAAPLTVNFNGSGSSDPDPLDTISYAWDLDGDGAFDDATAAQPSFVYTAPGVYNAALHVTDQAGLFDTETVQIVVDNGSIPPIVTTVTPAAGATEVLPGANMTATFSEAISASTVNASTFELRDPSGALVSAVVSYDAGTLTATLNPVNPLAVSSGLYTVRVVGGAVGVTDLAGNPLAADYTWSFSTEVAPMTVLGPPTVDGNGVEYYSVVSAYQGAQPTTLRILEPTNPTPGEAQRFVFFLPVDPGVTGLGSEFGDGLEQARILNLHNLYNAVLVAPSFHIEPWYGDHDSDPTRRLESFLVQHVAPFVDQFAAPGTTPDRWLVGFSKSGFGALSMIFRHPAAFTAAAAWDVPAQFTDLSV